MPRCPNDRAPNRLKPGSNSRPAALQRKLPALPMPSASQGHPRFRVRSPHRKPLPAAIVPKMLTFEAGKDLNPRAHSPQPVAAIAPGNPHLSARPLEKVNRFLGLSTVPVLVSPKPATPEKPHLKISYGQGERIRHAHQTLLKNLTFLNPPSHYGEFHVFTYQRSAVSERQLAPEKAHLGGFFDSNQLLKRLTLRPCGVKSTTGFAALRQTPVKTHLDAQMALKISLCAAAPTRTRTLALL